MQWLVDGDYKVIRSLSPGLELLEDYLLEIREFADPEEAAAATAEDVKWQHWLSFCQHSSLLQPLFCHARGSQAVVVYPRKGVEAVWPSYVEQAFGEYMADENLTLELTFRLTLIWGSLLGKGLRPVGLERPRPELILLSGDGDVRALPLRFQAHEESGASSILVGLAHILFEALTRQSVQAEFLPRCRDLNREISLDAQTLVRRCLPEDKEAFDTPGALTRALTRLNIRRNADEPYRDQGPLVAYRPYVPDRDYVPEMKQAAAEVQPLAPEPPAWLFLLYNLKFFQDLRNLRLMFVLIYLGVLSPLFFVELERGALAVYLVLISIVYWMCAMAVYTGYRRRNVSFTRRKF